MSEKLEKDAIARHDCAAMEFQLFLCIAGILSLAFLLVIFGVIVGETK